MNPNLDSDINFKINLFLFSWSLQLTSTFCPLS